MTGVTGPYVLVSGPGEATAEEEAWAEEVGRLVAEAGGIVLCGGLRGVMDAAARGARTAGGISVGILPGESRTGSGTSLTVAIPTGVGETRNALLVRAADVVIAISGEFGTLSEIAFALKMGKPVIGLHTWDLSKPGDGVDPIVRVTSPEEAVARALAEAGRGGG
ncbi:MAG TPA: TIGR00725 family protein [Actinomycetota bacterium]|nr:TIGR00725 family protein [Actinomycetota bacterium]